MNTPKYPEPTIKSYSIAQIYNMYINRKLIVNRNYQRKLCWTIEEKRNFIDTIINNLPVPMIILAERDDGKFEIIDGMQRIESISALIEQKYKLKNGFYDLESMSDTIEMLRSGKISQLSPLIKKQDCITIANYPIPVSIFQFNDENQIESTFKRINSAGRHLSLQELRQAGYNTNFSKLVRELATSIRGDISSNELDLNEMSSISLSNHKLPYGIFTGRMFWIRQGIINTTLLRQSCDEEIIAKIIAHVILSGEHIRKFTPFFLNSIYGYDPNPLATEKPKEMTAIENAISRTGKDTIIDIFTRIMSIIKSTIFAAKMSFNKLLYVSPSKDISFSFHAVFVSIYNIVYKDNKDIVNYKELSKLLNKIGDDALSGKDLTSYVQLNKCISYIQAVISPAFSGTSTKRHTHAPLAQELENMINSARTEQSYYDFKAGFVTFGNDKININSIEKIIKTLSSMNNNGPGKTSYVIVGIAENKQAAEDHKKIYISRYREVHDRAFVVGIGDEARRLGKNIDNYTHEIKEKIRNSQSVAEEYKIHLLQSMKTALFYGYDLVIFSSNYHEAVMYKEELFVRLFTDVNKVKPSEYPAIFKKFYSK